MNHHTQHTGNYYEAIIILIVFLALLIYPLAVAVTNRKYKTWPQHRLFFWSIGVLCAGSALIGPLATLAHSNFTAHMLGHLMLGMLAPLLLAFATPVTLILRTLSIPTARKLTFILRSQPIRFISNPVTAALLNIGGLYVLYTTDLYLLMHQYLFVYSMVHLHLFLAGYLFTISIIYIDITPHRYSYIYRSIVLILALAGHKILSKTIYAYPPTAVPRAEAEAGGMLMYYGGDVIELTLIFVLCYQWYKANAPRLMAMADE